MPTALFGLLAWLGVAVWLGTGLGDDITLAELIVAFVALVVVPLLLPLTIPRDRSQPDRDVIVPRWLSGPHALAALAVAVGVAVVATGTPAAVGLAGLWLAFCGLAAVHAMRRLLPRGRHHLPELAIDLGLLFLPGGGVWLFAYRGELTLGGFGGLAALLTAGHFHVAGFGVLVMTGLLGRGLAVTGPPLARRLYGLVAPALMVAFPLVAAGIATGLRPFELAGAGVYAVALPMLAGLQLVAAVRMHGRSGVDRIALACSAVALLVALGFALRFASAGFYGAAVPISTMLRWHATVNTIGFVGLGVLAWSRLQSPALAGRCGLPFSRLRSRGYVGSDYFERTAPGREPAPQGLVDSLAVYDRPGFVANAVAASVRDFYERTAFQEFSVAPRWRVPFRLGGRLWHALGLRIGQMTLPLNSHEPRAMPSRIVAIDAAIDGRPGVRGWVRTLGVGGPPVYVAAYATHRDPDGVVYMNIAFPLPRCNLASILRIDHDSTRPGGVVLTTCSVGPDDRGDQGIYVVFGGGTVRVPMNETIWVWPEPGDAARVRARHRVWLFGLTCVELEYTISSQA